MSKIDIAKLRLFNQQLENPQLTTPVEVVKWMGAMQAQDWAVGIRMKKPDGKRVREAFDCGEIVRTHLNRATWQLVAADDLPWMLMLHGERSRRAWRNFALSTGAPLTDEMMNDSHALLTELLRGGRFMTREELWPYYRSLGIYDERVFRHLLVVAEGEGLICSGPVLGRGASFSLTEERVGNCICTISREEALARLATRYFQSHAPASLTDFVWWSGLTLSDCRQAMALIRDDLSSFETDGEIYYMHSLNLKGRLSKDLIHLLPAFDELLIGYKSRTLSVPEIYKSRAYNNSGIFYPVILSGSQVVGNWVRKNISYSFFEDIPISETALMKAIDRYRKFLDSYLI